MILIREDRTSFCIDIATVVPCHINESGQLLLWCGIGQAANLLLALCLNLGDPHGQDARATEYSSRSSSDNHSHVSHIQGPGCGYSHCLWLARHTVHCRPEHVGHVVTLTQGCGGEGRSEWLGGQGVHPPSQPPINLLKQPINPRLVEPFLRWFQTTGRSESPGQILWRVHFPRKVERFMIESSRR
ncbi:hypothetical protein RRG08_055078 [Elysia crispata]|uniref:Uncharacterized protein n=1 Tax=Elysia crispata TaxID=231223 RepID=A0AAE1B1W9_9GAST|nr:hypothetical protein RRG08_055078 [Elysia crispata]